MRPAICVRQYVESKLGILVLVEPGGVASQVEKSLYKLHQACCEFEESTGVLIRHDNFIDEFTFSHLLFDGDVDKKEYVLACKLRACRDALLDIIEERLSGMSKSAKQAAIVDSLMAPSTRNIEKILYSALKSAISSASSITMDECKKAARKRIRHNIDTVFDNYSRITPEDMYHRAYEEKCEVRFFSSKSIRTSALENAAMAIMMQGLEN